MIVIYFICFSLYLPPLSQPSQVLPLVSTSMTLIQFEWLNTYWFDNVTAQPEPTQSKANQMFGEFY